MMLYRKMYSLLAKNFFRDFRSVFFTFVLPIFLLVIFYFIYKNESKQAGHMIAGGYILLGPVTAGFNALSFAVMEWKNSILLKRIDATPLKKWQFLFGLVTFYFVLSILSSLWIFIWTIIIEPSSVKNFSQINWGYFILGLTFVILLSLIMAIFIAGISKSEGICQAITFSIYFPSMFLGGLVIPTSAFSEGTEILNTIGYFIPHKYAISVALLGWNNNILTISQYGFSHTWIAVTASALFFVFFAILTWMTFRWETSR